MLQGRVVPSATPLDYFAAIKVSTTRATPR